MEVKSTSTGILIIEHKKTPEQKQKEKLAERKFGLLELRNAENREVVNKAIRDIYLTNELAGGGGIILRPEQEEARKARRLLIQYVYEQLL